MKTKLISTIILFILITISSQTLRADTNEMVLKLTESLEPYLKKAWPKGSLAHKPNSLHFAFNTMEYMIHNIIKKGIISEKAHKEIGPKHNGIIIVISLRNGKYEGTAELPQDIRRPYWTTRLFKVDLKNKKGFAKVNISYGSGISSANLIKIQKLIEQTISGK
ncbi:MAG: hypothetical protein COA79_19280 [Planctomycetota bacterium]|nr:MAG: hypothetical protein COA79_19280 [Planctomycetota bacterium]